MKPDYSDESTKQARLVSQLEDRGVVIKWRKKVKDRPDMKKEIALPLAALALIVASFASCGESPQSAYIDGPNAGSEECKEIAEGWNGMVERHSDEDTQAENRATADSDRVMRSSMTEAQKQIALNNLTAKEEAAKAGREARQSNEAISLRERERIAGCQIENPKR